MSNFHPLKVVGRGSETQLQVGENLNFITSRVNPARHYVTHADPSQLHLL